MSDLGIFSPLVVGRDMPHPFAGATEAIPRSADRFTPIAQHHRAGLRVTKRSIEAGRDALSDAGGRLS
jgi:hypothetical protein